MSYAIDFTDPAVRDEVLAQINASTGELNKALGVTFVDVAEGRLVATMPVEGNRQPFGLLHGGASCALAESLGSVAAGLHAGPDSVPVGVDLNATHHRSARDGVVTGVCTPIHEGRSTATYEIVISDAEGRRLCTSRITCQLLSRRPAS